MNDLLNKKIELIQTFIDNTPIAYVVLDRAYRIHYINKSFVKLRKLDMSTTIGNRCYNLSNGGVRCKTCAVAKTLKTGEKSLLTRKDILHDGTVRFIDDYAIPLQFDEHNRVEFVLEIMIDRTKEMLANERKNADYDEILSMLASLLEAKDSYTANHSDNVRKLSLNLALALGLPLPEVFEISVAASLHDIGKVTIPDSIINKVGKLDDEEYMTIKNHSRASYEILEGLASFGKIRDIALHHHERVDGRGYPDGLTGDEMTVGAKIVAIADTYDAITTTRSYRKALSREYALDEIKRVSGKQLDEELCRVFCGMDFENMQNSVYDSPAKGVKREVERVITMADNENVLGEEEMKKLSGIDMEHLFTEMFASTPCGYLMMDREQNVLFSSEYLQNYVEMNQLTGKKWYEVLGIDKPTHENSVVERSIESAKIESGRQEILSCSNHRIFDIYAVPIVNEEGVVENVIGAIIDRTSEVLLKRERKRDFDKLLNNMSKIIELKKEEIDEKNMSAQIEIIQKRIGELVG